MKEKTKYNQIVIRLKPALDRKIERLAEKSGLTKAAWGRQLFIRAIEAEELKEMEITKNPAH